MYTLYNKSQSIKAVCFSLFELSILNLLHNASRLIPEPGNLFRAISKVSITNSFEIFFFLLVVIHYLSEKYQSLRYE